MRNGLLFPNPTNDKAASKQMFLVIVTDYDTSRVMRRCVLKCTVMFNTRTDKYFKISHVKGNCK
jgi:hypothetical protein